VTDDEAASTNRCREEHLRFAKQLPVHKHMN
jgi:hypothetical protein